MALHIVNQSPYRSSALRECLAAMAEGDALLLIEDGVYAATGSEAATMPVATYCLQADVSARGIEAEKSIELIDEQRWVALCVEHAPIVSWF